ncbi:hypothetical protein [Methylobacterium sp.]|nr:hypothetical protein [Methylobacterium sp.]
MITNPLTAGAICIACLIISNWVNHNEIRLLRKELKQIRQRLDVRD